MSDQPGLSPQAQAAAALLGGGDAGGNNNPSPATPPPASGQNGNEPAQQPFSPNPNQTGLGDQTQQQPNQPQPQPTQQSQGQQQGNLNPAWSKLLGAVPEMFHESMYPVLREWDQNFQQVQSSYSPYKEFADRGVSAEDISGALGVIDMINNDPTQFYEMMAGWMAEQGLLDMGDQGQQGPNGQVDIEGQPESNPQIDQLSQTVTGLSEIIQQQQQAAQEAELSQQIDNELAAVEQKYPGIDQAMVLQTALAQQVDIAQAAEALNEYNQRLIGASRQQQQSAAPVWSPAGAGAVPAIQQPNTAEMSDKDRMSLVAQVLKQANQG